MEKNTALPHTVSWIKGALLGREENGRERERVYVGRRGRGKVKWR